MQSILQINTGKWFWAVALGLALAAFDRTIVVAQDVDQVEQITQVEDVPNEAIREAQQTQALPQESDPALRRWSGRFLRRFDSRRYVTGYRGSMTPYVPNHPQGAYLGVELDSRYPQDAVVAHVTPGTPAAEAGLKQGDRIWAINDQPVDGINELIHQVGRMEPGQRVDISFDRPQAAQVILGQRSQAEPADSGGQEATGEPAGDARPGPKPAEEKPPVAPDAANVKSR